MHDWTYKKYYFKISIFLYKTKPTWEHLKLNCRVKLKRKKLTKGKEKSKE